MKRRQNFKIVKESGRRESFLEEKLFRSLILSGSDEKLAKLILEKIRPKLHEGIKTGQIYRLAFRELKRYSKVKALHYGLKKSLIGLGPEGFFFEKFISYLFIKQGFEVSLDLEKPGKCAEHEIDIIATKNDASYFVECKFHNSPSKKNNLKTALYVSARARDLKESVHFNNEFYFDKFFLISNSKFTEDAISYSHCANITLIGSNYPFKKNLYDLILEYKLFPITSLSKLKKRDVLKLFENNIFLCEQIKDNPIILDQFMFEEKYQLQIINEVTKFFSGDE